MVIRHNELFQISEGHHIVWQLRESIPSQIEHFKPLDVHQSGDTGEGHIIVRYVKDLK